MTDEIDIDQLPGTPLEPIIPGPTRSATVSRANPEREARLDRIAEAYPEAAAEARRAGSVASIDDSPITVHNGEDGRPMAALYPSRHADRRWHVVIRQWDNLLTCSCPGAIYNRDRGGCWAMKAAVGLLHGFLPSGGAVHDAD